MDQDEKTARGHRSPAVRSTAPAGTPYPVVPNPPPPVPPPTNSQPRTVGGHTARLNIPDDDSLDFDPLAESSIPSPLPSRPFGGAPLSEPISTTLGGTQRLQHVSPDEAADAKEKIAREEAEKKHVVARRPPAPTVDMEPATLKGGAPPGDPPKPAAPKDEGPSILSLLFAPISVAVGLSFFAMGSILTLIVEGRFIRLTVTVPAETVSLPAPSATPAPHVGGGSGGGAGAGPTHPAAHPPTATAPSNPPASTGGGAAAATSTAKPSVPASAGTSRPQGGGTGKRPPIIF